MNQTNYYADWDVSSADILETVVSPVDNDCEAIIIDVWVHWSHRWEYKPHLGITVDAHDGMFSRCLIA